MNDENEEFRIPVRKKLASKKYVCSSCGKDNLLTQREREFTPVLDPQLHLLGYADWRGNKYSKDEGKKMMRAVTFGGSDAISCKKCNKFFCDSCYTSRCPNCNGDSTFKELL